MPPKAKLGIPRGYTFSNRGVLMNKKTLTRYGRLVKKIGKEFDKDNEDDEDIYFSSDYTLYTVMDIMDETMVAIHTFVTQKDWLNAWYALFALSEVRTSISGFSTCDDGERVCAMECAFAALLVTTLRGLENLRPSLLTEEKLPELERALTRMGEWANEWADTFDCEYNTVLNGYGRKLFGNCTLEERDRKKEERRSLYEKFYNNMSEEEREKKGYLPPRPASDPDAEKGEDSEIWYGQADPSDTKFNHASFQLSSSWKAYKPHIREKGGKKRESKTVWVTVGPRDRGFSPYY